MAVLFDDVTGRQCKADDWRGWLGYEVDEHCAIFKDNGDGYSRGATMRRNEE